MGIPPLDKLVLSLSLILVTCGRASFGNEYAQKEEIDAIVAPLIDADEVVGAVVGIVTPKGNHVFGYGATKHFGAVTPDGDTIFEIGSLTKVFAGVLLAEMLERKEVRLDDPAQMYLPESVVVPTVANREMTLRHLATHTSGLPQDPTNLRPKTMLNRYDGYTEQQLYACLAAIAKSRQQPIAKAGAASLPYQYSNVGAGLLGHLLERNAEKSFEQLLVERICDPLELSDTRISLDKVQEQRLASGYFFYDQLAPSGSSGCLPAYGGLRSSANDLVKLLSLHLNDNATTLAAAAAFASKPQFPVNDKGSVGLFWQIETNSMTVWHGGTTTGFTSAMAFHKDSGTGVVVLTNSKSLVITPLVGAILVALRGGDSKPIPIRKRIPLKNEILESYTGTYQDKRKPLLESLRSTRTVTRDGNHLLVKGIGGETFPLYADSVSSFFCKGEAIDATFEQNKDGKTLELNLNLWGYRTNLTKIQ